MGRIHNLTLTQLESISAHLDFNIDSLEKAIRMADFLNDIFNHPYLSKKFLLKGGTGLNFYFLNIPRLSVDIDLNYIGSIDREIMKSDKEIIKQELQKIIVDKKYTILYSPDDSYAGGKIILGYKNIFSRNKNLEIDINYMYRYPINSPVSGQIKIFSDVLGDISVQLVSREEMIAGKVIAVLQRSLSRDIFDLYNILNNLKFDENLLRKIVILFGISMREDFRKISHLNLRINDNEFNNSLKPLLRSGAEKFRGKLIKSAKPFLERLLNFSNQDKIFIDKFLDNGEFLPELLFKEFPDLLPGIKQHPLVLWKRKNILEYLNR